MKHRLSNVIETLMRLPNPEYKDQVIDVPVLKELSECDYSDSSDICINKEELITLTAEVYSNSSHSWFEWELDL